MDDGGNRRDVMVLPPKQGEACARLRQGAAAYQFRVRRSLTLPWSDVAYSKRELPRKVRLTFSSRGFMVNLLQSKGTDVRTHIRVGLVAVVLGGMTVVTASTAEFPLRVQELSLSEAMSLAGGYGAYGSLSAVKPAQVKKLPATQSKYPLFSALAREGGGRRMVEDGMVFMLDESGGTGKGYDRLVVDLNGNGDLTDDPVWERIEDGSGEFSRHYERQRFGPVPMPESAQVGAWRPRVYVEVLIYNREMLGHGQGEMLQFIGQMRVRPGNLLVAEVEVNGMKQRLGVVDGNANFRIGDSPEVAEFRRSPGGRQIWNLRPNDYLLRDLDGSGSFRDAAGLPIAEPLSSLAYFAGKPFNVELGPKLEWIRFEPYAGATGTLDAGDDVSWLLLGRQQSGGAWEAIAPSLEGGKAVVPAGTYRVSNVAVESRDDRRFRLTGYDVPLQAIEVTSGQTVKTGMGSPIRLEVTANRRTARPGESMGVMGAIRSMFGGRRGGEDFILEIGVSVLGKAGEVYTGFSAADEARLAPPRFEIFTEGKAVGSGDFEYG